MDIYTEEGVSLVYINNVQFHICAWHAGTKHRTYHPGQHILHYVSKFPYCDRDNYFVIGEKPSQKHF